MECALQHAATVAPESCTAAHCCCFICQLPCLPVLPLLCGASAGLSSDEPPALEAHTDSEQDSEDEYGAAVGGGEQLHSAWMGLCMV